MDPETPIKPTQVAAPAGLEPEPEAKTEAAPAPERAAEALAPAPPPQTPPWWEHIPALAESFHAWLCRPRVRLTVTGGTLLLLGGLVLTNSVWTLPLVLVGALMVAVAWIGHRLEGRFEVEWGEAGTQLAFRARIGPAHVPPSALPRTSSSSQTPLGSGPAESEPEQIIEGEAHTIEIEVAELEALIAAAETGAAETGAAGAGAPPAAQKLRVAATDARSSNQPPR
jgi:hypothetical protein